ncbi:MAG: signal transduction histidine kinase, LytS [Bacteroidetes bacterium]|jgi:hypothetical protein|nr:signal transduction histidine kinase, LytS [Bacteroidota bacterium]
MSWKRGLFFILSGLFWPFISVRAQDPVYINYNVDNGLPSNEVYDIFEDSLGYIWIATDHGISRFNGYNFKNYSTSDGLEHNVVFGFFEDNRRRVWMRTLNNALCYLENGKIYPYVHNASLQLFLGKNFIQTFAVDSTSDLWFMSIRKPFGLFRQSYKTGKIERIKLRPGTNAFIRELSGNTFIAGIDMEEQNKTWHDSIFFSDHTWQFQTKIAAHHSGRLLVPGSFIFSGYY